MQEIKLKDGSVEREFFKPEVNYSELRASRGAIRQALIQHATLGIVAKMDQHLGEVEKKHGRPVSVTRRRIGRNDPCPCGSGVKFKKCHLNQAR